MGEGVETEEIRKRLSAAGSDIAQAFLLARPMRLGDLELTPVAAAPLRAVA